MPPKKKQKQRASPAAAGGGGGHQPQLPDLRKQGSLNYAFVDAHLAALGLGISLNLDNLTPGQDSVPHREEFGNMLRNAHLSHGGTMPKVPKQRCRHCKSGPIGTGCSRSCGQAQFYRKSDHKGKCVVCSRMHSVKNGRGLQCQTKLGHVVGLVDLVILLRLGRGSASELREAVETLMQRMEQYMQAVQSHFETNRRAPLALGGYTAAVKRLCQDITTAERTLFWASSRNVRWRDATTGFKTGTLSGSVDSGYIARVDGDVNATRHMASAEAVREAMRSNVMARYTVAKAKARPSFTDELDDQDAYFRRCGGGHGDEEEVDGHEWLGQRVRRFDHDTGHPIDGTLQSWVPADEEDPALWHMVHDDGDKEDLDEHEVKEALLLLKNDVKAIAVAPVGGLSEPGSDSGGGGGTGGHYQRLRQGGKRKARIESDSESEAESGGGGGGSGSGGSGKRNLCSESDTESEAEWGGSGGSGGSGNDGSGNDAAAARKGAPVAGFGYESE
jgi:hypothetical protein